MSTEPAQSRLGLVGSTVMTLAYQPMLYKVCEAEQMGELSTEVLSRIELVLSVITTQDPESPFDTGGSARPSGGPRTGVAAAVSRPGVLPSLAGREVNRLADSMNGKRGDRQQRCRSAGRRAAAQPGAPPQHYPGARAGRLGDEQRPRHYPKARQRT